MPISTAFENELKQALKHLHDLPRLEAESPLASYYFLGSRLVQDATEMVQRSRGARLRQVIIEAAEALWQPLGTLHNVPTAHEQFLQAIELVQQQAGQGAHAYVLLELRCLQRFIKPKRLSEIWESYLPGSRAEHYRDYDSAVSQLATQLLRMVRPTFRLETPPETVPLIGVEAQIAQAVEALHQRQSLCIHGPSGIGKSALAVATVGRVAPDGCFWFTIRPTLNDHLNSLLFMLGYFLQSQGAPGLWQLLLLNAGKIDDLNLALSVTHADLAQLRAKPLVLCFDELELLQHSDPEQITPAHSQILRFIEGVQGHAALLLLTQRPTLNADHYLALSGLPSPQIKQFFQQEGIALTKEDLQQVYQQTNGNLRLLTLLRNLLQRGEAVSTLFVLPEQTLTLLPLVHRLFLRLTTAERRLLQQIAVFRGVAPLDQWEGKAEALQTLIAQRLLQRDGQGGIFLLPALRCVIYEELSPDLRVRLHRAAAGIRAVRGETTAAAYHLWRGGDETGAVQLWYSHRQQEMERGQAAAAHAIFNALERHRLRPKERKVLDLLRAELLRFQGEIQQGLALLEAQDWSELSELAVYAQQLQGRFEDELGYPDAALQSFAAGEATIRRLLDQLTDYHFRAGMVHVRQKEHGAAWESLRRAEYAIGALRGNLLEQEGKYAEAAAAYCGALAAAEALDLRSEGARIERFLAALRGRQGEMDAALQHSEAAAAVYRATGDLLNLHIVQSNLSAIHLGMQAFEEVMAVGKEALAFFQAINNPHFLATTAANLAEASYELGDWAAAELYAYLVLDQEEPYAYPYAHYTLGLTRQAEGKMAAAEQHLLESARFANESQDRYMEAFARRALGQLYRAQGQEEAATRMFTMALRIFEQLGIERERQATAALLQSSV